MTGSTPRPAALSTELSEALPTALPTTPDRRRTVVLAGAAILVSTLALLAQQMISPGAGVVPSLIGAAGQLALAAAVLGLARLRAAGTGRAARLGLALWALSALLQIAISLNIQEADIQPDGSSSGGSIQWAWIAVTAVWLVSLTVGSLVAGVGVVRAGVLTGWRRWVPLAEAVAQILLFVPPSLGISALYGVIGIPAIALHLLFGGALLTAFRGGAVTGAWARSGAVLDTP